MSEQMAPTAHDSAGARTPALTALALVFFASNSILS
jgi:hypothetical protein